MNTTLNTQATSQNNEDIALYDLNGNPVAAIANHAKGQILFLTNRPYAEPVATLSGSEIRGLNGNFLADYFQEVIYVNKKPIGFTKNSFKGQLKPGPQNYSKKAVPNDFAANAFRFDRESANPCQDFQSLEAVLKSGALNKI